MRNAFLTQSASVTIAERFQAECLRKPSSKPVFASSSQACGSSSSKSESTNSIRTSPASTASRRVGDQHLAIVLRRQLPGGPEPDRPGRHVLDPGDHQQG